MVGDPVALRYQDKRGRWKVRQFWQGTRTAFGKVTRGYEENGKPMVDVDDVPVTWSLPADHVRVFGCPVFTRYELYCAQKFGAMLFPGAMPLRKRLPRMVARLRLVGALMSSTRVRPDEFDTYMC